MGSKVRERMEMRRKGRCGHCEIFARVDEGQLPHLLSLRRPLEEVSCNDDDYTAHDENQIHSNQTMTTLADVVVETLFP